MKKMIMMVAAAILVFTGCAEAQTGAGIKFSDAKTFAAVQAEAVKADKPIFVDIYTTWCPPCKMLSKNIFPTKVAGDYMNATFVNAKFDAEKGEGITIAKKYKVTGYPTLLILNSKGEELGRIVGGSRTPEAFVKGMKDKMAAIAKK